MNNFSIKRLGLYARAELCSNRKQLIMFSAGAFSFFMMVFYTSYLWTNPDSRYEHVNYFVNAIGASWLTLLIFSLVNISTAFKKYFDKGSATATLMLPVAPREKFAFALLFYVVVVPIVLVAMAYLVSLVWSVGCGVENRFFPMDEGFTVFGFSYTPLFMFFLGAIFFRRNQFFWTMLSIFSIGVVIGYSIYLLNHMGLGFSAAAYWLRDIVIKYDGEQLLQFFRIASHVFNVALSLAFCIFAWRKFRKLQITK